MSLTVLLGQSNAQSINFEQVFLAPPEPQVNNIFEGVQDGASAFADVNGDSYPDLLITGRSNAFQRFSKLYLNDGQANFSELPNTPFPGLTESAVAFADVDGDGDQDVMMSGRDAAFQYRTLLYLNNGAGGFTLVPNTPFPPVIEGSIAFADVDGDNDQDVVLTGLNLLNRLECALFLNNGSGFFSLDPTTNFAEVRRSDIAFVDVDMDNDQDLMVTGDIVAGGSNVSILYINDGNGNFMAQLANPFEDVQEGAIQFFDFDGNQTQDLLITGQNISGTLISQLYSNTGNGLFAAVNTVSFAPVFRSQVATGDLNNDGHIDVFISGQPASGLNTAHLYLNNGDSTFMEVLDIPVDGVRRGDADILDLDADLDLDLFVSGEKIGNIFNAIMYLNDSSGTLYEAGGHFFQGLYDGSLSAADVDGDLDVDFFASGFTDFPDPKSTLFLNNGNGFFTPSTDTVFVPIHSSSSAFFDADGDLDQDLLVLGRNDMGTADAKLYLNDGVGSYSISTVANLQGLRNSALAIGDLDGDSIPDIIAAGRNGLNQRVAQQYLNDGTGSFSLVAGTTFPGVEAGSLSLGDVDGDNDLDLFISGRHAFQVDTAKLFLNDGSGNFSIDASQDFLNVQNSQSVFVDVDGDLDLDLVYSGEADTATISVIYLNDGQGVFTLDPTNQLLGLQVGSIEAADLEGDGDIDLIMSGLDTLELRTTLVYQNDGTGTFSVDSTVDLRGLYTSASVLADFSANQFPDLLMTGLNNSGQSVAYLYGNKPCFTTTSTDSITACDTYTWLDGITYTASDTNATFLTQNAGGCDSIISLHLTILSSTSASLSPVVCESYLSPSGNIFTSSGIYQDTLPNAIGCDSLITINLTVNNSSTATISPSICAGESYLSPSGNQLLALAGTYLDTIPNLAGCDSLITINLSVDPVEVGLSNDAASITANASGATYQWLDCNNAFAAINGETNQSFLPAANGSYAVEITQNGCVDTSVCVVMGNVGIAQNDFGDKLHFYPNPTSGKIVIELDQIYPSVSLQVYNSLGQLLEQKQWQERQTIEYQLEGPAGVYLLRLEAGDKVAQIKVIKD